MTVTEALLKGIALATRHWKALLVVYAVNLLLAISLAAPVYRAVDDDLSWTESADRMAEGFDWLWYEEFAASRDADSDLSATIAPWQTGLAPLMRNFEGFVRGTLRGSLPRGLAWVGIIYVLLTTLLTGGILGLFAEERSRFTFRFFFDRAGRYFLMLLGILVVARVLYWLLWHPLAGAHQALVATIRAEAATEWTPVLIDWVGVAIVMVLAFAIHMVMNYARVAVVAWERMGLVPALLGALGFCLRNLRKTLGLFYLTTLLAVVIALVYGLLVKLGGGAGTLQLLVLFIVQQLFILGSIWIRMVYLGSQMAFYRGAMNMPILATPSGPAPDGLEEEVEIEEAALV
jgi:hypothetical protein